jgi:hypothetical protein
MVCFSIAHVDHLLWRENDTPLALKFIENPPIRLNTEDFRTVIGCCVVVHDDGVVLAWRHS